MSRLKIPKLKDNCGIFKYFNPVYTLNLKNIISPSRTV
ncbi:hypothetical protein TPE_1054 [Treponema pedis str. T A4]|uniref:Uncharacterized protein n=1 Tax=Treponema pedis str. T A4 TaxID=1291379 RepID=S5ZTT3_9SPIR|nr:hypothetical protein TPE_1054 [Treponema pedis str. T A4]